MPASPLRAVAAGAAIAALAACAPQPPRVAAAVAPIELAEVRHPDGETPDWWFRAGAAAAHANLPQRARAKNVIVFLGDGMSVPTIAAARILDGSAAARPARRTASRSNASRRPRSAAPTKPTGRRPIPPAR